MSEFKNRVIKIVSVIPKGKVMSYGQVALYSGTPRAARQVGWILNKTKPDMNLPWWRVVNNAGRISIKNFIFSPVDQKRLLESEGLQISDDFTFDIEKYRYLPTDQDVRNFRLDREYVLHSIIDRV